MSGYDLTLSEVEPRLTIAISTLERLPWPSSIALVSLHEGVEASLVQLRELRWLCELTRNAAAGLVVVVEDTDR